MARTRPAITDDRNVRFPPQRYPPCIGGLRAVDANECQTTGRFSAKSAGAAKSDPHHCNGGRGAPPVGGNRDDRKSVVEGRSVSGRVDLGGRRSIKKKKERKEPRED